VKVLFDHNVPYGLRKALTDHSVFLADQMGWAEIGNGELLRRAEEAGFEVMLTCDQNLIYQQNMAKRQIALVIPGTNNWHLIQRIFDRSQKSLAPLSRVAFATPRPSSA